MQICILSNWRVMSHQHKASPRIRFHQTNHLCKVGKIPVVELSPVTFQHYFFYSVFCPIRTILWNLFDGKFLINSNKSPEIVNDSNLNIKPGIQILSNALDIFKNTAYSFSLHQFGVGWESVWLIKATFSVGLDKVAAKEAKKNINILYPFVSLQSIF